MQGCSQYLGNTRLVNKQTIASKTTQHYKLATNTNTYINISLTEYIKNYKKESHAKKEKKKVKQLK